jgi:hypothetical protein
MIYLQETTNWTDATPNHTYIFENKKSMKALGYIKAGDNKVIMFNKPLSFDKKKRTFKEITI